MTPALTCTDLSPPPGVHGGQVPLASFDPLECGRPQVPGHNTAQNRMMGTPFAARFLSVPTFRRKTFGRPILPQKTPLMYLVSTAYPPFNGRIAAPDRTNEGVRRALTAFTARSFSSVHRSRDVSRALPFSHRLPERSAVFSRRLRKSQCQHWPHHNTCRTKDGSP